MLVVDASVALKWGLDEGGNEAMALAALRYAATFGLAVPAMWIYEVSNGLRSAVRRNRLGEEQARIFLAELKAMHVEVIVADTADMQRLFALSSATGLTVYDTSYLDLAMRRGYPLATFDEALKDAAQSYGVELYA